MTSPKVLRALSTDPMAHMRFVSTGRLPRTIKPDSPLIRILDRLSPRDRIRILGLKVGPGLGYAGVRRFHTAEQALNWCRPAREMLESESFPADSWRMKGFHKEIYLDDLLACAASFPEGLKSAYPRLCNPLVVARPADEASDGQVADPTSEPPPPTGDAP